MNDDVTMNIYAAPGTAVVFAYPRNGYLPDQERARKYLSVGKVYTVAGTRVHSSHTDVMLREFPGLTFNSVMFR